MHQMSIFYSDDDQSNREQDEDYNGLFGFITKNSSKNNKKESINSGKIIEVTATHQTANPSYREQFQHNQESDNEQLHATQKPHNLEDDQSSTQAETQPCQAQKPPKSKIVISPHQFYKMYFELCLFANKMTPSPSINTDPYYKYVYDSIIRDLNYRQTLNHNRSTFRSKIRTFIIKKILQQFISKMRQEHYGNAVIVVEEGTHRRLSKGDRQFFNKQKIRHPPCQISMNYISKIFESQKLRELYLDYLSSGKMKTCILRKNYDEVKQFCEKIERIAQEKCSLKDKKEYFELLKKPMCMQEIQDYLSEAEKIGQKFCDMADRPVIELN